MRKWQVLIRGAAVTALAALAAGAATLPAGASPAASGSSWRAHSVLRLGFSVMTAAVNPRAGVAYELVNRTTAGAGPFQLRRIALSSGHVLKGPEFRADQLRLAGGYVWVSGGIAQGHDVRLVLNQVDPTTLRVLHSWKLTGEQPAGIQNVPVATGPGQTVWVGFKNRLWQLNTRTGARELQGSLAAGLSVSDLAVDPAHRHLYVSLAPKNGGAVMREYNARSLSLLASSSRKPLQFSVSGAALTAVPGRVWASFRTGMAGETIALRQLGLSLVHVTGGQGLFGWFMVGTTSYGGGSVWLGLNNGDAGCVNPSTGAVRSRGHLRLLVGGGVLLAVSAARREVYALGQNDILAITAPAACWR